MAELEQRYAFGRALVEYGSLDARMVVLDADTASSTMSALFQARFPDRFFNIGISEPCMVDVAVGLALGGLIPFVNGFAALLSLRTLEQIRSCVCYGRTNVKLMASYAGLSDFKDGPTHHSIVDLALLRVLPEMTVIVPADANEVARWVPVVAEYDGPVYMRLNRSATLGVHPPDMEVRIGKGITLLQGGDVTLVATGSMVGRSVLAADRLAQKGVGARVIEIHTLKPIDKELLCQAAAATGAVVTAEEHSVLGGLGSAVSEVLAGEIPVPVERVGIRDTFARTGPDPESLMDAYGLGVGDIVLAAEKVLARKYTGAKS
jgi:transketolase